MKRERRASYTEQQLQAQQAQADGSKPSGLIASVEAVAGLWERAFSSGVSEVLSPWLLALLGRRLILNGEAVAWKGSGGLLPVSSHTVEGKSADPDRWRYTLNLPAPGGVLTKSNVPADRVLHVRIGATMAQPWRGCSPLVSAGASRGLLEQVEQSLLHEHRIPVSAVVAVSDPDGSQEVVNAMAAGNGAVLLGDADEVGLPGEKSGRRSDWAMNRFGPVPSQTSSLVRDGVERSLLGAAGVPVELVSPGPASDAREAWRRFLWSTIAPVAGLVSHELRRLGLESGLSFAALNASDLAGRARAFKQLHEAQVDAAEARRICGFD